MSTTLYLDRRSTSLELQGGAIAIYVDGSLQRTLPVSVIDRVVCRSNVTFKSNLLVKLASEGVAVSCFSRFGSNEVHVGVAGTRDANRRIEQYRLWLDEGRRSELARSIVLTKIKKQRRLLVRARSQRADQRYRVSGVINSLDGIIETLTKVQNSNIETIRGLEGSAAREYFKAFCCLFPDDFEFNGRNRRPAKDPVNAALSLGYSLQFGEIVRVLSSLGLDVYLGSLHEVVHGRQSLACDFQEVFRPDMDAFVWNLFRTRQLKASDFSNEGDACLLKKEGRSLFYGAYQEHFGHLFDIANRIAWRAMKEWKLV